MAGVDRPTHAAVETTGRLLRRNLRTARSAGYRQPVRCRVARIFLAARTEVEPRETSRWLDFQPLRGSTTSRPRLDFSHCAAVGGGASPAVRAGYGAAGTGTSGVRVPSA